MTAFEPPDFTYFTGLQFNPEIYENALTATSGVVSSVIGSLVTIIGTISTIITTPLFKVIQGVTTTIEATEAYTEFKNTVYSKIYHDRLHRNELPNE